MDFEAGLGGRARFGEVEGGVDCGREGGGEEVRLVGICGGSVGSGGGELELEASCSVERILLWRVEDGEGGFGGEYWVAASTLCLGGDLAGATGDLADVNGRLEDKARGETGDCLPKEGAGGGRGPAWRGVCRGDCEAECRSDPLLLERTGHDATPEEVEEELECKVRDGEAVIISLGGCRGRCRSRFRGRRNGEACAYLWSNFECGDSVRL